MIALSQVVRTCLSLDKFTIEVNGIFDSLVFDGKDFDPLDHLIKEELCQDVVRGDTFLSRETEIDPIFHHEEGLLSFGALQAFEKLLVNLRHCPGFDFFCTAFVVDKAVSKLGADADVGIS